MPLKSRPALRVVAAVVAFVIIAGLLFFANGLVGNPISRILAKSSARKHIAANHPDLSLDLAKVGYDFKSGGYYIEAQSPTSIDTHFTLRFDPYGKFERSDYTYRVVDKYNTFDRIADEYRRAVKTVTDAEGFPYSAYISYGEIVPYYDHKEYGPSYGLNVSQLELDKIYNVKELGKTTGHLVFYVEDETITVARAAEVLLGLKNIFDGHGIPFYALDFNLIEPRGDEKPAMDGPRINVQEFLYEDIYEVGLEERVAAAHEALNEFYAEQDAKRKD